MPASGAGGAPGGHARWTRQCTGAVRCRCGSRALLSAPDRLLWAVRVRWLAIAGFLTLSMVAHAFGLFAVDRAGGTGGDRRRRPQRAERLVRAARAATCVAVTAVAIPMDHILSTYLVVNTGGVQSPFMMLYIVQVLATAMLVDTRGRGGQRRARHPAVAAPASACRRRAICTAPPLFAAGRRLPARPLYHGDLGGLPALLPGAARLSRRLHLRALARQRARPGGEEPPPGGRAGIGAGGAPGSGRGLRAAEADRGAARAVREDAQPRRAGGRDRARAEQSDQLRVGERRAPAGLHRPAAPGARRLRAARRLPPRRAGRRRRPCAASCASIRCSPICPGCWTTARRARGAPSRSSASCAPSRAATSATAGGSPTCTAASTAPCGLLAPRLKDHITVHRDFGDLPEVECLPGQLNQVFMNLLANAVDAIGRAPRQHLDHDARSRATVRSRR